MNYLEKYGYQPDEMAIALALERIANGLGALKTPEVYKICFSMMDLTTLKTNDTPRSVTRFVNKVNDFRNAYPEWPLPASICVYSNFAGLVKEVKKSDEVHVTVVSACFPSSQSFLEVKLKEVELAVKAGADEVDIVLAHNSFLDGDFETCSNEIRQVRKTIDENAGDRKVILKVILETGLLANAVNIANASFLAMEAGADFIKTSTGKVDINATPFAAYVMCECIAKYKEATGRQIGFKPAGGMTVAADALTYFGIAVAVLGAKNINPNTLRFGVSRLGNSLLSEALGTQVSYF